MGNICASCAAENGENQKFCGQCGTPLTRSCADCGAELAPGQKFCGECGSRADGEATPSQPAAPATTVSSGSEAAVAERRLVSVVFVDLVGFTNMSEGRDPEEVRELLSDYFEQARTVVDRYDGVVEKFIGDAVMAVWGTPIAREDDAERAVRAALEMVDAVDELGETSGIPGLSARAGVVTGHVAVTLGADGQGMVAGDIVNTASRVQSTAESQQVLVDDTTRTATSSSIGYASAGVHSLKGKAEPVELFRARSVVAGSGGAQRVDGLEAPFIGRGRELRLVKELFHDSTEQSRARLLSVTGVTGVGKSRLGWEFFKYIDGLAGMMLWHIGRSLSYGGGTAYWSLAEMVRMRFRITEGDADEVALERMNAGLDEYITDPDERRWIRPRLAVLLGIAGLVPEQPGDGSRDELFAGWRLFFERLAEREPVVMMFEDMHGADEGVLDFIEHLLEWSSHLPIFIVTLARPELEERRPEWARQRNATSLHLELLAADAVSEIIDGLVGGLPETMRDQLAERAEGMPVFAIEIVRMLIDRDIVVPQGGSYVLAQHVTSFDELDVPATLHALVAARLDNLPDADRWLVSDAAVIGHSFTPEALTAVVAATGRSADTIGDQLSDLVRKEVLTAHSDPRSPERGQYKFVQKVMRSVAYETLSRRDRKARHLIVAEYLEGALDADEIAGVLAAHYSDAADAIPDADDFADLQDAARRHLIAAADRAAKLGATDEALRYYERALGISTDDGERAWLAEQSGAAALATTTAEQALAHYEAAEALYRALGDGAGVARVVAAQADTLMDLDRHDDGAARATRCYEEFDSELGNADRATLANVIAASMSTTGRRDEAAPWVEIAMTAAEDAASWDALTRAFNVKGILLWEQGRRVEATVLMKAALDLGLEHDLGVRTIVQYGNLALNALDHDLVESLDLATKALDAAVRVGDRRMGAFAYGTRQAALLHLGRWDEMMSGGDEWMEYEGTITWRSTLSFPLICAGSWRGGDVSELLDSLPGEVSDPATKVVIAAGRAVAAHGRGDTETAFAEASEAVETGIALNDSEEFLVLLPIFLDSALASGRLAEASATVDELSQRPAGRTSAAIKAQLARFSARIAAARGEHDSVDRAFVEAVRLFSQYGAPFWTAWTLLEHAEWAAAQGRRDQAAELAARSAGMFENLDATPFVERARAAAGALNHDSVDA